MDPFHASTPSRGGYLEKNDATIYYEIRDPNNLTTTAAGDRDKSPAIIVMIMGAFATHRHFDEFADLLASSGYVVLTYDHRGIGKSSVRDKSQAQSSRMLANDCLALIDHCFGSTSSVHVYGASMGGCVAQHVGLSLESQGRLQSLYLAVTTRGNWLGSKLPIPQGMWAFMVQYFIIESDVNKMVASLVSKCFDDKYLEKPYSSSPAGVAGLHGGGSSSSSSSSSPKAATYREKWTEKWTREYTEWFSFADPQACASQCSVFANHYISDAELAPLIAPESRPGDARPSKKVTVQIATEDQLIPPAKQRELAALLRARVVVFEGGHVGGDLQVVLRAYLEHLKQFL